MRILPKPFLVAVLASSALFGAVLAQAGSNDLVAFLERAEQMYTPHRSVRADITLSEEGKEARKFVLILDPSANRQMLFSVGDGSRSVGPLAWPESGKTSAFDASFAGSDLRLIDWFPFWKTDYTASFISDENRNEKTVSLYAPDGNPYQLFVISFDKTKLVPRMVKYYQESFSNLVRIRTDSEHQVIAARPRPTKILFQDYAENTEREYSLTWSELESAPADLQTWTPE